MYFNVAQLLKEPMGATRHVSLSGEGPERARGPMEMVRTDRGILVRADLTANVETTCSRCLGPCDCPVKVRFEEEFFPVMDVLTGLPVEASEDEDAFTIDENHVLDLSEAVRQYSSLALPLKPLCREGCPGLCPQCGANLNEGSCTCKAPARDQCWAKLESAFGGPSRGDNDLRSR